MSALDKYFIKGKFEGHFTTRQVKELTTSDVLPKGQEHQVNLYRGIITESKEIQKEEFDSGQAFYHFKRINNIQINTSPDWPVENDRIYSFNDLKLANVNVSNVEVFKDKTTGIIHGDVIGSVADRPFDDLTDSEPYNPGKGAKPFNPDGTDGDGTSDDGTNDNGNNNGSNNGDNLGSNNSDDTSPNPAPGPSFAEKSGCNRLKNQGCNTKWLRWLLQLLLILLLLYLLAKCTQVGRNLYCKLDNWRIEQKTKRIKGEIDSLLLKISETEPQLEPCGGSIDHDGKNEYWDQRFNIGNKDGTVSVSFDALGIPDRLEVIYDGKLVAETNSDRIKGFPKLNGKGFQQGKTVLSFYYKYDKNKPTELLLRVIPNKDESTTRWHIDLSCPQ